jgi:subtilisin
MFWRMTFGLALVTSALLATEPGFELPVRASLSIPGGGFLPRNLVQASALAGEQYGWGITEKGINAPAAWKASRGQGATVAIFDTGIDATHPEFRGRAIVQKDFTGSSRGTADIVGHGTHCAGIVGMAEDGVGYVGVAPLARLVGAKVLGDDGKGNFDWLLPALKWAVEEQKADVISLSLSAYDPRALEAFQPALRAYLQKITTSGVIVVVAAGNDHPSRPVGFPGRFPEVVCVAAANVKREISSFSSRGAKGTVDVAGPGEDIISCIPGNRYAEWDGTSMATPMVAGVAALYVGRCKDLGRKPSQAEFVSILQKSSITAVPEAERPSPASGWGLIQAPAFVDFGEVVELPPKPLDRKLTLTRNDFTPEAWKKIELTLPGLKQLDLTFEPGK